MVQVRLNKEVTAKDFMRDSKGESRRMARNSQPSTSSGGDHVPSRAVDQMSERRTRAKRSGTADVSTVSTLSQYGPSQRRRSTLAQVDALPETILSSKKRSTKENAETELVGHISSTVSSSGLRRSTREPRPKRTLSPTPTSPKRRNRMKRPNFGVADEDCKETEASSKDDGTRKGIDHKAPLFQIEGVSLLKLEGVGSPFVSIKSVDIDPDPGDGSVCADDDMENDLVDIQPFDSGDVTEVFLTAHFSGKGNFEAYVDVSVVAIPQQLENIEHSTAYVEQHASSCDFTPILSKKNVPESSVQKDSVHPAGSDTLSTNVLQNPTASFTANVRQLLNKKPSVTQDPRNTYEISNENEFAGEDFSGQMEPPVLEPIIGPVSSDIKPGVELPPTLTADGVVGKENPKPMHYVVGEIYRVHTPNGTEQEVQLAVMDDGTEALVNANGELVDMEPEDTYAAIDICDVEFNFLDDRTVVCGLCGEVVPYVTLFTGHLTRHHPEMLEPDMLVGEMTYVDFLKTKLENDRKNIQNGFKYGKQSLFRKTPRKVSQIRINPSEMTMPQLEIALKKKLLEKMGRRVNVSLVDKEHVKCGVCNSVISINKKFEIVHVVRHFNAWHPTNHQCAGQWPKRTQRPGVGKPLSKQDFAVIDLSHTQPDNLQCIWCGMFIDATTIAVHFTDCHPGEVEVPKCLLCIQELVINARVIEKFGSDFDIVLQDEFHIKVGKLGKSFTSESLMDNAIEKYLELLNGKRKRAPMTVERRVFEGDSVVVQTTAIPGEEDSADDLDLEANTEPPRKTNTNSRMIFGKHNKPKRSMVQPSYRQAPPTNSEYVKVINDSHWKCKICDADLYGAVISACAIRHFKLKHPQESDSLQFEVVRARLDRISDGCMEFVHPQMLECLICHLTYQLHKPYNVCRGIRHLKSRHPEIMPEFNGEPLRRYRKTGTALRLDDDPNIPRRRREIHPPNNESDMLSRMKAQYPNSFDKVQTVYGDSGEPMYVLMGGEGGNDEIVKESIEKVTNAVEREQNGEHVQEKKEQNTIVDVKLGSRREVVFELSYDYDHLDADGKPQKHLVRVTPSSEVAAASKPTPCSSAHSSIFKENELNSVRAASHNEANEVFFGEPEQQECNSTEESSTVVLGDVLFVDADGNEIIQRTTALPDGTYQQQYLGQAEDGSLFLLDDIVSAGLHPYAETVEEVYDDGIIDENVEAQGMVLQEDYGNAADESCTNVTGSRSGETSRGEYVGSVVQRPYSSAENVMQEVYSGQRDIRHQIDSNAASNESVHYDENVVSLNTNEYEHRVREYTEEQQFEETPATDKQK